MDFTRKARWVKDGHKKADPLGSNYAGVVSRDTVRITFTYATLNDLNVCAADVRNAYIQAPSSEHHYIICGPEFGENEGRTAIIVRALYGVNLRAEITGCTFVCACNFLAFSLVRQIPILGCKLRSAKTTRTIMNMFFYMSTIV